MSEETKALRLEGIVRASRRDPSGQGKGFLGAAIECNDGTAWVITYQEDSPFHLFADQHVVIVGEPYKPKGQALIRWHGRQVGHFRVSSIQLVEET